MPWDKGFPSPALVDLFSSATNTTNSPSYGSNGSAVAAIREAQIKGNKKAIVPGCGKGYDVKLLAEHGYDSFGVDIAPKAVELARSWYAENEIVRGGEAGKGKVGFILGDFFTDDWLRREVMGEEGGAVGAVDLIYDYTVSYNAYRDLGGLIEIPPKIAYDMNR